MGKNAKRSLEFILAGMIGIGAGVIMNNIVHSVQNASAHVKMIYQGGRGLSAAHTQKLLSDIGYNQIEPEYDISNVTKAIWYDHTGVVGDPPLTLKIQDWVHPSYELMVWDSEGNFRDISVSEDKPEDGKIDNYCISVKNEGDKESRFLLWDADGLYKNDTAISVPETVTRQVAQNFYDASRRMFDDAIIKWVKFTHQNVMEHLPHKP